MVDGAYCSAKSALGFLTVCSTLFAAGSLVGWGLSADDWYKVIGGALLFVAAFAISFWEHGYRLYRIEAEAKEKLVQEKDAVAVTLDDVREEFLKRAETAQSMLNESNYSGKDVRDFIDNVTRLVELCFRDSAVKKFKSKFHKNRDANRPEELNIMLNGILAWLRDNRRIEHVAGELKVGITRSAFNAACSEKW